MQPFFCFFLLYFNMLSLQTEKDNPCRNIEENLMVQLEVFPQEKIHIHTDRDFYVPGEIIWFKTYVVDAHSHLFPTHSRYVYVELINPNDSLVNRVMIRSAEDDMFIGHLPVSENIQAGNYTLRAYTLHLENLGDGYFFKKNIRIGNLPSGKMNTNESVQRREKERTVNEDFEVSFFPEGGNLPEGVFCRVAFKALNNNGYPEIIAGDIVDENGTKITSVQTFHAGMGVFTFIPESDKRYFLSCRNERGHAKQFELPQSNPHVYALTASRKNNRFIVGVQKSLSSPEIPCYLLVHCRGMALYFSEWNNQKEAIIFEEEKLPAGVIQLLLFDEQMNPLSERLVFSKNFELVNVEFHTDKDCYEKREKVITTLNLSSSPFERAGMRSHLSVAITDDKDISVDESTTILSSLILSSELKGYIENPACYLQDNHKSVIALDYLMMTHGWRRYNIPKAVKGNPDYPQIPYQITQEISGQVKSPGLSRPVSDSEISIMTEDGFWGLTLTDEQGSFIFRDFEYPDSTSYFVQALNKRGSDRIELVLDRELFPPLIYALQSPITPISSIMEDTKNASKPSAFITKAEQRSKYNNDMRVIHLNEVEVIAQRMVRNNEPRLRFPLNAGSDFTLRSEVFNKTSPPHASALLRGIPGVYVTMEGNPIVGNSNLNSFSLSNNAPLVLIDGIVIEGTVFANEKSLLTVQEIESIDVFKGPNAAIFGARGSNGVISITTKRGLDYTDPQRKYFNYTVYTPLGFQKPVEFYAPRYESLEAKNLSVPDYRTTVFWKPDIIISDAGKATFDFFTSDFQTTYSVVIEGITTDGRIIRQVEKIRVE